MSCSTKPGPAAVCAYVEKTTGYEISSADWHTLTRLAGEAGFTTGKGRVSQEEAEEAAQALFRALYRKGDPSTDASDLRRALVTGGLTKNSLAVVEYLTSQTHVPSTLAKVAAARNPKAAALSDRPTDRLYAAEGDVSKKGVAEILLKDRRPEVRDRLLVNPTIPEDVLYGLAKKADSVEAMRIASNPSVSEKVLMVFAESYDEALRKEAAVSPYATPEVLNVMSRDRNETLRVYTATNENLPLEVQRRLASDNPRVRRALAANRVTDAKILSDLAEDEDRDVRMAVARNSHTPTAAMERLAEDEDVRGVGYRARVALSARAENERLGRS